MLYKVKYEDREWCVIDDFKMIGFLTGLQGGYTKHMCFLWLWDSGADHVHYKHKSWPKRQKPIVGVDNIEKEALVPKFQNSFTTSSY